MTPVQKKMIQEIPTWTYRAIIGGMLTLMMIWFNDFRGDYKELKTDHYQLKSDFQSHKEIQRGEINLLTSNIKTLARNQDVLFNFKKGSDEE